MNALLSSVSAADLRLAAEIKEKIDSLQNELGRILGSNSVTVGGRERGRKMSAAAKARIAAGARARWAKVSQTTISKTKKRMTRSSAVRARLSAIAKARWKKAKAAGKSAL